LGAFENSLMAGKDVVFDTLSSVPFVGETLKILSGLAGLFDAIGDEKRRQLLAAAAESLGVPFAVVKPLSSADAFAVTQGVRLADMLEAREFRLNQIETLVTWTARTDTQLCFDQRVIFQLVNFFQFIREANLNSGVEFLVRSAEKQDAVLREREDMIRLAQELMPGSVTTERRDARVPELITCATFDQAAFFNLRQSMIFLRGEIPSLRTVIRDVRAIWEGRAGIKPSPVATGTATPAVAVTAAAGLGAIALLALLFGV